MTPAELKSLRESLGLPVQWCAARVGRVDVRTWRYWEHGRDGKTFAIPDDVIQGMRKLERALKPWSDKAGECR